MDKPTKAQLDSFNNPGCNLCGQSFEAHGNDPDAPCPPKPKRVKRWMGLRPGVCDLCTQSLGVEFIDGATQMGPWAIMCPACHARKGVGLGTGRGQKYDRATLIKVGG